MSLGAASPILKEAKDKEFLPGLPNEILVEILLRLDLKNLLISMLVSKGWRSQATFPVVGQGLIRQYLPYLGTASPEDEEGPFTLFKGEYRQGMDRIKDHPEYELMKPFVLECLGGNLENIMDPKFKLSSDAIRTLCQLAAASGHHQAVALLYSPQFDGGGGAQPAWEVKFMFLNPVTKMRFLKNGDNFNDLILASAQGDLNAINSALIAEQGPCKSKRNLYILSAICGNIDGLSRLDDDGKREALFFAAQISSRSAFEMIFAKANIMFSNDTIESALFMAIRYGQLRIVQYILRQRPAEYYPLLRSACRYNQMHIVDYFLFEFGPQLTVAQKCELLNDAMSSTGLNELLKIRFTWKLLVRFVVETSLNVEFQAALIDLLKTLCRRCGESDVPTLLTIVEDRCLRPQMVPRELKVALLLAAKLLKEQPNDENPRLLDGIIALGDELLAADEVPSVPTLVRQFERLRIPHHRSDDEGPNIEEENQSDEAYNPYKYD